jgi:hypothetical protein
MQMFLHRKRCRLPVGARYLGVVLFASFSVALEEVSLIGL